MVLAAGLLCGCAFAPPPPAFTGPTAVISMTSVARGSLAANDFYVSKIDGQDFLGSMHPGPPPPDTPMNAVTGQIGTADIPAGRPVRFTLVGHSVFQAPIVGMAMADYSFSGDTSFTPVAGEGYAVRGIFTPKYSALWIETIDTAKIIAPKVEFFGSTEVPLAKKTLVCNPSFS